MPPHIKDRVEQYRSTALNTLVDRMTAAVDHYVRSGGADFEELTRIVESTLAVSIPTWANVHVVEGGGFVEAVIWVPDAE